MLPLCADEGVGTMVWSPLARGRLARPWQAAATNRSGSDPAVDLLYTDQTADSDRAIIDAVGDIAASHGVSRATIALAWLHHRSVVTAPIVGANTIAQIDDAIASVDMELSNGELDQLEWPYTPRDNLQGLDDDHTRRVRTQSRALLPQH